MAGDGGDLLLSRYLVHEYNALGAGTSVLTAFCVITASPERHLKNLFATNRIFLQHLALLTNPVLLPFRQSLPAAERSNLTYTIEKLMEHSWCVFAPPQPHRLAATCGAFLSRP